MNNYIDRSTPVDKIDFSVQPITADFLRNNPYKGLILSKYHDWVEAQRIADKKEQIKITSKIYRFKREKKKREREKEDETKKE